MTIGPEGGRKVKLQIGLVQFGPSTFNCFNLITQISKSNQFYPFESFIYLKF